MLSVFNFIMNRNLNLLIILNKVLVGGILFLKIYEILFVIVVIKYLFIKYRNDFNKIFFL